MSNDAGSGTKIFIGTTTGLLLAAITFLGTLWYRGELVPFFGGVSKKDFAPFKACVEDEKIYAPGHVDAGKNKCLTLGRHLSLDKDISQPGNISGATFQKDFPLSKDSVVFISAYVTSSRDGEAPYSYVRVKILVDGRVCGIDEEFLSGGADGRPMHAAATCNLQLPAGNHPVSVERKEFGVKGNDTKLSLKHTILTH